MKPWGLHPGKGFVFVLLSRAERVVRSDHPARRWAGEGQEEAGTIPGCLSACLQGIVKY